MKPLKYATLQPVKNKQAVLQRQVHVLKYMTDHMSQGTAFCNMEVSVVNL